jgi:hypothetical protein
MSYSTSTPPKLLAGSMASTGPSLWTYESTDAAATVDAANYFTNAAQLGMKVGDLILVTDTDASPPIVTIHRYNAAGDVTDGDTLVTGTDSD